VIGITTALAFVVGLVVGSFFNVLIYRLPRDESIVWPGSRCPGCGHAIRWYENIPLLSYLFLQGSCSACKAGISPVYPVVELTTGLLTVLLWRVRWLPFLAGSHAPLEWVEPVMQTLSLLVLIPVAVIDLRHYIIPDAISLTGLALALAVSFIPDGITPQQSLLGVAAGGGFLLLTGLIGEWLLRRKDAMGGGDIKLMAFLGAAWGPLAAFLGIVLGSLVGALVGLGLLFFKALREDHRLPFGPFLAGGFWIAALAGERIISLYITLTDRLVMHIVSP
jgi:leader peptidase (prepilin peptidase)/N-methyltransferase